MTFRRGLFLALLLAAGAIVARADEPILLVLPPPVAELPGIEVAAPEEPAPPTTKPSRPATRPVSAVTAEQLLADLGAADAAVRERALADMLFLTRDDLPALRRAVERSRPIAPSQAAALREAVNHIYLSDEPYAADLAAGFLGLMRPALDSVEVNRGQPQPEEVVLGIGVGGDWNTGVPIEYRIPGYCAFRSLREGDVVWSIQAPAQRRLHDWQELSYSVRSFKPGQTITFEVVRQGAVVSVPVMLDARPFVPRMQEHLWQEEILPARQAKAQTYWKEHFAHLLDDRVAATP